MTVLDASLLPLADYMNRILGTEQVMSRKDTMDFMDVPKEIRQMRQDDSSNVPSYKPEILDEYGRVMGEQSQGEVTQGAAVAGAAAGFMMGGPFGALLGAAIGGAAANRGDVLGDAAKAAGKMTNIGIKKAKEVDDRFRITERVGDAVKKGVSKVKAAVDSLEESS